MLRPDFRHLSCALAATLLLAPVAAQAQGTSLSFELGLGTSYSPTYEGSDEYRAGPTVQGALNAVSFGPLSVGGSGGTGFGIAPSFRYLAERDDADYSELKGIDDVDWALEVGVKAAYRWQNAEVSAAVRQGFGGHHGVVADFAANAIVRPGPDTTIRMGPRLSMANTEYAETYFSVPSTSANFARYSADGGVKSVGIGIIARQELSEAWAIEGKLGWNRLMNDFADSPITKAGNRDQYSIGVSLIREFNWRF